MCFGRKSLSTRVWPFLDRPARRPYTTARQNIALTDPALDLRPVAL